MKKLLKKKLLKRQLALALTTGLSLSGGASLAALNPAAPYKDVPSNNWASKYVGYLSNQNVVTGYPDNTFRPQQPVSRAEFAAMLAKSQHLNAQANAATRFRDVPQSHWASGVIQAAVNKGWLKGYPDNSFRPNQPISAAEMYAILAQLLPGQSPTDMAADPVIRSFEDATTVPEWAEGAIAEAVEAGVYLKEVNPKRLSPSRSITRAEMATALAKLVNEEYRTAWTADGRETQPLLTLKGQLKQQNGQWLFVATSGKQYVINGPSDFDASQFNSGKQVEAALMLDTKASVDNAVIVKRLDPVTVHQQTSYTATLQPTVEAGGWIANTGSQRLLLLNVDDAKQHSWFKAGAKVQLEGELQPDTPTIYMEGIPIRVTNIQPVK